MDMGLNQSGDYPRIWINKKEQIREHEEAKEHTQIGAVSWMFFGDRSVGPARLVFFVFLFMFSFSCQIKRARGVNPFLHDQMKVFISRDYGKMAGI